MNFSNMPTRRILKRIEILQDTQKKHHPKTMAWGQASALLKPLFEEMARRMS